MNTKYSNWKMWYYVLCMVLTLQLAACSEETHDEYTAAPEIEDTYIDQLDALIAEMTDLQQNSDYGDKKGQYPTESRAILTDAIDDANRAVLLIKYQQPSPSESEKQRYVAEAKASIENSSRVRSVQRMLKQHRLNCLWTDVVMVVLISISDVAKNMSISEPKEIKPLLLSFG